MGCRNSVQIHEGESDGSTVDPELIETTCMVCKKRTPQIAIQNDSERVLYAVVMDDINAQIVKRLNASVNISTSGASGGVGAVWDFARVSTQTKMLLRGSRTLFHINGDCCFVWISDRNNFPLSSTPYSSTRIPKGHVQVIRDDVFCVLVAGAQTEGRNKFQDFLSKPLSACRLLDVPGIGRANAQKLEAAGCASATKLKDIFITNCHSSVDELVAWFTTRCGIQGRYATEAAHALQDKVNSANTAAAEQGGNNAAIVSAPVGGP